MATPTITDCWTPPAFEAHMRRVLRRLRDEVAGPVLSLREQARRVAATAPPLSAEQSAQLRLLLSPRQVESAAVA